MTSEARKVKLFHGIYPKKSQIVARKRLKKQKKVDVANEKLNIKKKKDRKKKWKEGNENQIKIKKTHNNISDNKQLWNEWQQIKNTTPH